MKEEKLFFKIQPKNSFQAVENAFYRAAPYVSTLICGEKALDYHPVFMYFFYFIHINLLISILFQMIDFSQNISHMQECLHRCKGFNFDFRLTFTWIINFPFSYVSDCIIAVRICSNWDIDDC